MTNTDTGEQVSIEPKQKGFWLWLTNLIGLIWSIHVLIAALLYPSFLLPDDRLPNAKKLARESLYKNLSLFFGTLILFINILCLVILFTRSTPIAIAKVVFVLTTWLLVGIIYIVANHLRSIYNLLSMLEDEAIQSRDQSVMLIRAGQAALSSGSRKLFGENSSEQLSFIQLLKKIGPLALLVVRKGNIVDIGVEAFKLVFIGARVFKKFF